MMRHKIDNLIMGTQFLIGMCYIRPTKAKYSETEDIGTILRIVENIRPMLKF